MLLLRFCFCFVCLLETKSHAANAGLSLQWLGIMGINTKYSSQQEESKNVHSGAKGCPQTSHKAKAGLELLIFQQPTPWAGITNVNTKYNSHLKGNKRVYSGAKYE